MPIKRIRSELGDFCAVAIVCVGSKLSAFFVECPEQAAEPFMGESARIIPSKIFDILSERTSGFVRWKCAVISFASESGRTFIHSAGGNSINFELFAGISRVSNFLKSPLPSDFNSSTFSGVGDLWSSTNSLFLNPPREHRVGECPGLDVLAQKYAAPSNIRAERVDFRFLYEPEVGVRIYWRDILAF